jgi:hypothetical protein
MELAGELSDMDGQAKGRVSGSRTSQTPYKAIANDPPRQTHYDERVLANAFRSWLPAQLAPAAGERFRRWALDVERWTLFF